MSDRLVAIEDRLARADEHFEEVERMVLGYFESNVNRFRGYYDPQARKGTIDSSFGPLPVRLGTVVGELVHDLRSALDHLAWQLVIEDGGEPGQYTCFPILKAPPKDDQGQPRPLEIRGGVSPRALALIELWQPYTIRLRGDRGDSWAEHSPLYVLHRLSIIDKHREIAVEGMAPSQLTGSFPAVGPPFTWHSELETATKHDATFRVVPDDPDVQMDCRLIAHVVVKEPPDWPNALPSALKGTRRLIGMIVDEARASCFKP